MYKVMVMLKWIGEFKTFLEAFEKLYWEVKKQVKQEKPRVVVITTNCIYYENFNYEKGRLTEREMNFNEARDFAFKMRYLSKDGELVKNGRKIPEDSVIKEFIKF